MRPFDESDLIAYHLHELPPPEEKELRYALHNNSALAAESASIAGMLAEYKHHSPSAIDPHAVERSWQAVRYALPRVPVAASPFFRWRLPLLAGVGFALAVPIFFAVRHPDGPELQREILHSHVADPTVSASTSSAPGSEQTTASVTEDPLPHFANHTGRSTMSAGTPSRAAMPKEAQPSPQANLTAPRSTTEPVTGLPLFPATPPTPAVLPSAGATSAQSNSTATLTQASAAPQATKARKASHRASETNLTLSMGGTFIATHGTTTKGITNSEGATNAVSAIASFHQQFRPFVGYRVTVSYARPEFHYFRSTATSTSGQQGINGRVYEVAGTYVIRGPHRGKVATYAEAGAGVMAFLPTIGNTGTDYNISPAGIVGVSTDIPVSKHFGLHAAYRVQVFKGPDFHADSTIYPLANSNILISQEPSVGITYRFTQKQQ